MIATVRHVNAWYYLLTGMIALLAVAWAFWRRRPRVALVVVAAGTALNLCWELALGTIWGRTYQTATAPIVQLGYHALTEFGPLLLVVLLAMDTHNWISLRDDHTGESGRWTRFIRGALVLYAGFVVTLGAGVVTAGVPRGQPITIERHVTWTFPVVETLLALAVITVCRSRRADGAVTMFLLMGSLNVLIEVIGLNTGIRTYTGLPAGLPAGVLALTIGYGEGGTATALVWLLLHTRRLVAPQFPWNRTQPDAAAADTQKHT